MKKEEMSVVLLALALLYRRSLFVEKLKQFHEKTIQLEDEEAAFLVELVLCGSFDEEMLESIFYLPKDLIIKIKDSFLN